MDERTLLKRAMAEVIGFDAARYLISNMRGRESGAEKAQRHLAMSKAFVRVWTGDDVMNYHLAMEVHDRTAEALTNHMDAVIGFDPAGGFDEQVLKAFCDRFFDIASASLEARVLEATE